MKTFSHPYPFDPTYGYSLEQLLRIEAPAGPCDLATFWKQTYSEARQIPLNLASREIACERPDIRLLEVEFDSWNGHRIGAWVTFPRVGSFERGVVVGHGYGGRDWPEFDLPVSPCAAIFPCARGFNRSASMHIPSDAAQHVLAGIESKESYIHRGCVVDLWEAASALLELFPQTANCLHYMGSSFGGGTGAMAIAWDHRFSSAYLCVPSFGNHPLRVSIPCVGSGEAVRMHYLQNPDAIQVLQYFDAAAIAKHIKLPVLCDCALFDPAVPPPGQFSIYNALQGPKELIVRSAGHYAYPGDLEEEQRSRAAQRAWFFKTQG